MDRCRDCGSILLQGGALQEIYLSCPRCDWSEEDEQPAFGEPAELNFDNDSLSPREAFEDTQPIVLDLDWLLDEDVD